MNSLEHSILQKYRFINLKKDKPMLRTLSCFNVKESVFNWIQFSKQSVFTKVYS